MYAYKMYIENKDLQDTLPLESKLLLNVGYYYTDQGSLVSTWPIFWMTRQ